MVNLSTFSYYGIMYERGASTEMEANLFCGNVTAQDVATSLVKFHTGIMCEQDYHIQGLN